MILRFRSQQGAHRLEAKENESFQSVIDKLMIELNLLPGGLSIFRDPQYKQHIEFDPQLTLSQLGLKNGDMFFANIDQSSAIPTQQASTSETKKDNGKASIYNVEQDEIDNILERTDGLIKRDRDPNFCTHAIKGMCDYCMPLEPYDPKYLEDKGIKHLSFQSYLRQVIPKQNYEKFLKDVSQSDGQVYPPLEEEDYRVKQNCKGGHPPWPASICSKCQPGAITLQRQKFRMVDHIEFSTPKVIETFLEGWRSTGFQRIGVLYGRYESYPEVPLGVKAIVECIYEPPQTGYTDELEIAEQDPDQAQLDEVAKYLGLQVVGVIYTDLTDDGTGTGKVLCKRHVDSYFMSSQEIYFSAKLQNMFKNRCRWSSSKHFGSKFVTCVISGNLSGDIEVEAYQVSNQAMAMIEADIVQPSVQPSSMLVRKSDSTHWVPEIFYKYQNEYKVIVKKNAAPAFPVEYLLVNVTHGFPQSPNPIFTSPIHFIPNNRVNERPSVASVHTFFQQGGNIKDFHLLMFLVLSGLLGNEEITKLLNIVKSPLPSDDPGLSREIYRLEHSDAWKTLITLADEAYKMENTGTSQSGGNHSEPWTCPHCTFTNTKASKDACEVCGLPPN